MGKRAGGPDRQVVPDLHGAIFARRGDPPAVGTERDAGDEAAVPAEHADPLAVDRDIPEPDGVVLRGAERSSCRRGKATARTKESCPRSTEIGPPEELIPDSNGLIPSGGGHAMAVRAVSDVVDHLVVPTEDARRREPLRIEKLDGTIGASRGEPLAIGAEGHAIWQHRPRSKTRTS